MSSSYQMWLTHNGGAEKLQFPVLPEIINIRKGNASKSVTIQGLGEVIIKSDPEAVIVSFSSFFPASPFPGVQVGQLVPPTDLKDRITIWQKSELPVQFLVTGTSINLYFRIESFPYYEVGGDIGTLHYSLTLKEYRIAKARQVAVDLPAKKAAVSGQTPARVDNRVTGQTYTVAKGDSLFKIAASKLGSGSRYPEIVALNPDIKNPNLIYPGQVLRLQA